LNIVYIGSAGVLSNIPLRVLLQNGVSIKAIALPAETVRFLENKPVTVADVKVGENESLSSSASLLEIAQSYQIPVIELPEHLSDAAEDLESIETDLILMSCFPKRLPAEIFQLPKYGCFNMHPSILPAYRGPSPVHWQCAHKVEESGVTVHQVNAEFDEGDIAIQKKIKTRNCVNKVELAYSLAILGGDALQELIDAITADKLTLVPQSDASASYYSFPE